MNLAGKKRLVVVQVVRGKAPTATGGRQLTVGEMYFDLPTLRNHLGQVGRVTKDGKKKLEG